MNEGDIFLFLQACWLLNSNKDLYQKDFPPEIRDMALKMISYLEKFEMKVKA